MSKIQRHKTYRSKDITQPPDNLACHRRRRAKNNDGLAKHETLPYRPQIGQTCLESSDYGRVLRSQRSNDLCQTLHPRFGAKTWSLSLTCGSVLCFSKLRLGGFDRWLSVLLGKSAVKTWPRKPSSSIDEKHGSGLLFVYQRGSRPSS